MSQNTFKKYWEGIFVNILSQRQWFRKLWRPVRHVKLCIMSHTHIIIWGLRRWTFFGRLLVYVEGWSLMLERREVHVGGGEVHDGGGGVMGGGGGGEGGGVEGRYNLTFGVWRELLASGAEYNGFPGFSDILLPMNSADPKSQSFPRHLSPWRQTITLPLLTSRWSMRSGWKQWR